LPKKKQTGMEIFGFFVNVRFWSSLDLTLNQRVWSWVDNMDALAREYADTHDPEIPAEIYRRARLLIGKAS
jgi:hypothetical protein